MNLNIAEETVKSQNNNIITKLINVTRQINDDFRKYFEVDKLYIMNNNDLKIIYFIIKYSFESKYNNCFSLFKKRQTYKNIYAKKVSKNCNILDSTKLIVKLINTFILNINIFSKLTKIKKELLNKKIYFLIKKLFIKDIISVNDMNIILCNKLLLSLYPDNNDFNLTINYNNNNIKNIKELFSAFDFLLSFTKYNLEEKDKAKLIELIKYFVNNIETTFFKNNINNNFILSRDDNTFKLIKLCKISDEIFNIIMPLLIRIYKNQFNIDYIYNDLSEQFTLKYNEETKKLTNYLKAKNLFLNELFLQEENINNEYFINSGFIFDNNEKNGIICSLSDNSGKSFPKDGFSIVISFCLMKNEKNNNKKSIFSFYSEDRKQFLKIYIENDLLKLNQNSKEIDLFYDIKLNTNYIFWIIYPNDKKKEILLYLNEKKNSIQTMKYPSFKYKEILIGFDVNISSKNRSINNFEGLLGTFILFNFCLINNKNDNQNYCKIMELKKDYELLVNIENKRDLIYIKKTVDVTLNRFKLNLNDKIDVIISPKSLGSIQDIQNIKNNFICNYYDYETSLIEKAYFIYKFVSDNSLSNNITYAIEYKNSLLEFYNNQGLKYLHMQLYFLLGLLSFKIKEKSKLNNNKETNICLDEDEIKEMNENLNNIFQLFFSFINSKTFINQQNKDDDAINNFFYTLNDLISIGLKYGFKIREILLNLIINKLQFFLSRNLLIDKCDFIFIYENYDIKDEKVFGLLFNSLILLIDDNDFYFDDNVKEYLFNKMINFDKIYIENNISKEIKKKYSELIQKFILISLKEKNYVLLEKYLYNLENNTNELKSYLISFKEKNSIFYFDDEGKLEMDELSEDNNNKNIFDMNSISKIKIIYKYFTNLFITIDSAENTKMNFLQFCSDKKPDLKEFFNGLIFFLIQEFDANINFFQIPNINEKISIKMKSGYYSEMIKCLCISFLDQIFTVKKIVGRKSTSFIQNYIKKPVKKTFTSISSFIYSDNSIKNKNQSNIGSFGENTDVNNTDKTNNDNKKNEMNNINSIFINFEFLNEINLSAFTISCFYLFLCKKQIKNKETVDIIKKIGNKQEIFEFIQKYNFSENFFINNKHYFDLINFIIEKLDKEGEKYDLIKLCFELNCELMVKSVQFYGDKNSGKKDEIIGYFFNYKENCIFNIAIYNLVKLNIELSTEDNQDKNSIKRKIYNNFLESIKDNFTKIIECSFLNFKDPFYFVTIYKCFINKYFDLDFIFGLIIIMINKFYSYNDEKIEDEKDTYKENIDKMLLIELNCKNLLYLIYKLIFYLERRSIIIQNIAFIKNIYQYLCFFLSQTNLFYLKILFSIEDNQSPTSNKKLIIEIIYEILLELNIEYLLDPQKKYLQCFEELLSDILNAKNFATKRANKNLIEGIIVIENNDKKKIEHTLFYVIDKIFYKKENSVKLSSDFKINSGSLKEIRTIFFEKYKNEFNEKENTYSICIVFIIKILISIKYIDELIDKNNINKEDTQLKNLLSQNFNILCKDFFKLNEKYSNIISSDAEGKYNNGLYKEIKISLINDFKSNKEIDINTYINKLLEYASDINTFSRVIYNYPGIVRAYTYKDFKILTKNFEKKKESNKTNINFQNISENSKNQILKKPKIINKRTKSKKYNLNLISKKDNKNSDNINEKKSINYIEKPLLKRDLINIYFSAYFQKMLIYDKDFLMIKKMYKYIYNDEIKDLDVFDDFNCPLKIKNYISNNHYFRPFLKKDFNFYDSGYLEISHGFLCNKLINVSINDIKEKYLFPSKEMSILCDYPNNFANLKNMKNYDCELLTNHGSIFGKFYIFDNGLLFLSDIENDKRNNPDFLDYILSTTNFDTLKIQKKIFIDYNKINEIINRTFCFHWTSQEFFMKNGKSYFFNFFKQSINEEIISIYKSKLKKIQFTFIQNPKEYFEKEDYTKKFKDNIITTFEYLLLLNKYSSRSYNNIMEYPVIPWLKYENKIRDFDLPMSLQTEQSKDQYEDKYYKFKAMNTPLSHSNHYSNAPYIYFYLARINPFTNGMIKFQGNTFEIPERQFISIYSTIQLCTSTSNNRESIPDIFETPEIFYNINCNDLGKSTTNRRGHNVKLIPYANNGIEYCYDLLDDINNNIEINNNINKWIDFIFGVNQYTNSNKEVNFRRFNDEFYAQNSNFQKQIMDLKNKKMDDNKIYTEVKGNIESPLNFGITPFQILSESAPRKNLINQNLNDNKEKADEIFNLKNIKNNENINNVIYFEINKKNKNIIVLYEHGLLNIFYQKKKKNKIEYDLFYEIKIKGLMLPNLISKYNFCEIKENVFIFCGFLDKTLKIYQKDMNVVNYLLDIYTTSILSINEKEFITGHTNGKLIKWELLNEISNHNQNAYKIKKHIEIKSNKNEILSIEYEEKLNILLCSDKNSIIIRSYYDFQFLAYIKIKEDISINKIIKTKIFNCNLIYVLVILNEKNSYELHCYSLNGTFYKKIEGNFNDFKIMKNGNIIINNLNNKELVFCKGCHFDKLFTKTFEFINKEDSICSFDFENPNIYYFCDKENDIISIKKVVCYSIN